MRRSRSVLLAAGVAVVAAAASLWAVTPASAASATATFRKVSEWGSGWEAQYTISNGGSSAISGWTVEFDLPAGTSVGTYWNAALTSSGQHYTFTNRSWNGDIAGGASVNIGFQGSGAGSPTNCRLNKLPCGGGTQAPTAGPTKPPPAASPSTAAPATPGPATPGPTKAPGDTPVAANGQLKVCGRQLCNSAGTAIQLRGMSTHGLQWYANCADGASLDVLAKEWNADVVRIAMYIQEGGYETNPRKFTDMVHEYIEMATARGMYVIVDWHMLSPGNPNINLDKAKTFFTEIANKHKDKPNVLYEVANEPNGVNWATVKQYADQIIPVIRGIDSDGVILVGTPHWSSLGVSGSGNQERDIIDNPLTQGNLMYVFHFYAASHGDLYLDTFSRAADALPLFVTEFGTQEASGDGGNNFGRAQQYIDLMATKKISWVNWNYSDDFRSGAVFTTDTCASGQYSGTSRLKPAGVWVRDRIRTPDDF